MQKGNKTTQEMGIFGKYLTLWVGLCIIVGVLIGKFLPVIPDLLSRFEYANVSLPVAILIWLMIYPMMLKIDFSSIVKATKKPKGLTITLITNWLIKPFTMYLIAAFFLKVVFNVWVNTELANEYLAGAVLLGAAPCTAMVFVWSHLTNGDPAYTLIQVAINDLIVLFAFTPIVAFLLGITNVVVPLDTLILSVILFVVIPLLGGFITRKRVVEKK
jgi:ACR3 family arsenite transporter